MVVLVVMMMMVIVTLMTAVLSVIAFGNMLVHVLLDSN